MKIFSTNNHVPSILHFLGTDLWVKCRIKSHLGDVYYVRPQTFIYDNFGTCNIFPGNWVDNYNDYNIPEMTMDYLDGWINFARPFQFSDIEVITPLEVLTTEELLDLMGCNR